MIKEIDNRVSNKSLWKQTNTGANNNDKGI